MDEVEHRRHEHKGELQRLGNPGEEGGEGARHHDPQHFRFVFRACALVNRQRRAGQAEHHNREEARLITTGDPHYRFARFNRLRAAEEVRNVVDTRHVEPEYGVQRMVQADRDQQAVKEGIDARADRAQLLDMFAEAHQPAEHHRPDEHHNEGDHNHHERGQDWHQAATAEEGERFRQLDAAEAVVQFSGNDTHHNTDELVFDFTEGGRHLVGRDFLDHGDGGR